MQLIGRIIRPETFEKLNSWYHEAKENLSDDCIFVLVGARSDLQ